MRSQAIFMIGDTRLSYAVLSEGLAAHHAAAALPGAVPPQSPETRKLFNMPSKKRFVGVLRKCLPCYSLVVFEDGCIRALGGPGGRPGGTFLWAKQRASSDWPMRTISW